MRVVGLDIGGANLKASDGESRSVTCAFPLWKHPERLASGLTHLLEEFGPYDAIAVTMTGELADCFETKAEGIDRILAAAEEVAPGRMHVWQSGGEFVSPAQARDLTRLVAAANWHALATWAGRLVPEGVGLLIDVGSTTTDVSPLKGGLPMPTGRTDIERLLSGELLYMGVRRTPVCCITDGVSFRDGMCRLAGELFATMGDVYLLLGELAEDSADRSTADGRPFTRSAACSRLAHMFCCDRTEVTEGELLQAASDVAAVHARRVEETVRRVVAGLKTMPEAIVLGGEGEFLARRVLSEIPETAPAEVVRLQQSLGPLHSQAACAFALARLGSERLG